MTPFRTIALFLLVSAAWNLAVPPLVSMAHAQPEEDNPIAAIMGAIAEQAPDLSLSESDYKMIRRSGNTFVVPRNLRQKLLFNVSSMPNQASLSCVRENKKIVGYRVEDISPRGILPYLGIKEGDIVRTVNGRLITSEQEAMELAAQLSMSELVHVEIMRGQARLPMRLTYKMSS